MIIEELSKAVRDRYRKKIAEGENLPPLNSPAVYAVIDALCDQLVETLGSGEEVFLLNFGKLTPIFRPKKTMPNKVVPGTMCTLPDRYRIKLTVYDVPQRKINALLAEDLASL